MKKAFLFRNKLYDHKPSDDAQWLKICQTGLISTTFEPM